jgi:hypothetical protein
VRGRAVELPLDAHLSDGETVAKMGHPDFAGIWADMVDRLDHLPLLIDAAFAL